MYNIKINKIMLYAREKALEMRKKGKFFIKELR